jgi:hypothetical protein
LVLSCASFSRGGNAAVHVRTFLRFNKTIGVLRTGDEVLTLSGDKRGGDSRSQVNLPETQSASSHAGSIVSNAGRQNL